MVFVSIFRLFLVSSTSLMGNLFLAGLQCDFAAVLSGDYFTHFSGLCLKWRLSKGEQQVVHKISLDPYNKTATFTAERKSFTTWLKRKQFYIHLAPRSSLPRYVV